MGLWGRYTPERETEWIDESPDVHATVPHERPPPPEPDASPTVISSPVPASPTGLPVGMRAEPRTNRQSPSHGSEEGAVEDLRVLDYLRSIDRNTHLAAEAAKVSATADARATALLEGGASFVRSFFLLSCGVLAVTGFLAMGTVCAFLILRGTP